MMTKKRFYIFEDNIRGNFGEVDKALNNTEIVDKLNEQQATIQSLKEENEELKSIKRFAENNGINILHIDTAFRNCWKDNANLVTKIRKQEDEISYWKHKLSSLLWILGQFDEQKVKKLLEELDDDHIPRVGDLLDELQTKCHRLEKAKGEKDCGHCKHFQLDGMFGFWCDKDHNWTLVNEYCSDFER